MPLMAERLCGNNKGLCDHRNVGGGVQEQSKLYTSYDVFLSIQIFKFLHI